MAPRLKTKRYQKPTSAVANLDFHDDGGGGGRQSMLFSNDFPTPFNF